MTLFSERPNDGTDPGSELGELQKDERAEDDTLDALDRAKLPPRRREQLETTLQDLREHEGGLVEEATEDGIRRALARTDLTPEDRQQFEQALERLRQPPPSS
jgi:hypothetical protein